MVLIFTASFAKMSHNTYISDILLRDFLPHLEGFRFNLRMKSRNFAGNFEGVSDVPKRLS